MPLFFYIDNDYNFKKFNEYMETSAMPEQKMPEPILITGYICGDYSYQEDLEHFREQYPNPNFLPKNPKIYSDGKVPILPGTAQNFLDFLGNGAGKFINQNVVSGGGGENSRKAFNRLNVPTQYTDTCETPPFPLPEIDSDQAYFAGVCQPSISLVIPIANHGSGAGTFTIKSGRGDVKRYLEKEVREKITGKLKTGIDILVNSISNEHLAETIAENKQGDIYTVVTTYLDRNGYALNKLLKKSRISFFSTKEFYWLLGKEDRSERFEGEVRRENFKNLREDMEGFASKNKLEGALIVTLGQYGAVHYHRAEGKKGVWTCLKKGIREDIQEFISNQKKSTNTMGDNFTAAATQASREGKSLKQAAREGCRFSIKQVLGYPEEINGDFNVEEI
jgi:sugar/nucleoside kinase (ribokinase family)